MKNRRDKMLSRVQVEWSLRMRVKSLNTISVSIGALSVFFLVSFFLTDSTLFSVDLVGFFGFHN